MNVFEAVRDAVTTRQAAEIYGIKIRRNGMACCPFHPDKTPSMKLDKRYHCFGCGADGDAINFVAEYFGLSKSDAAKQLAADFGICYEEKDESWRPSVRTAPKLTPAQEYQRAEYRCYRVYCDYCHLLREWKEERRPQSPEEKFDGLFVEACHKLSYVEYVLDEIFLSGTIEERAEFVREHGKEIPELEKRISEFAIRETEGGASGSQGDGSAVDPQAKPEDGIHE